MQSSSFPLSPSSLRALATPDPGHCFADQFGSNSMSRTRASALFPASDVRPSSIVPEVFQALSRFRSVDDSRTRPVAGASAGCNVWSSLSLSHGLSLKCHSNREMEDSHAYPLGPFNST